MEYKITYTNRKTIGIYIHKNGEVEVRCPKRTGKKIIQEIIDKKKEWIERSKEKMLEKTQKEPDESEKILLIERAKEILPKRVQYFSEVMGVKPVSVKIGKAKSYWGFCSRDNRIVFSWRLMRASEKAIDYVVVHELAHIKEHNHSKAFWKEIEKIIPDYRCDIEELRNLY